MATNQSGRSWFRRAASELVDRAFLGNRGHDYNSGYWNAQGAREGGMSGIARVVGGALGGPIGGGIAGWLTNRYFNGQGGDAQPFDLSRLEYGQNDRPPPTPVDPDWQMVPSGGGNFGRSAMSAGSHTIAEGAAAQRMFGDMRDGQMAARNEEQRQQWHTRARGIRQ